MLRNILFAAFASFFASSSWTAIAQSKPRPDESGQVRTADTYHILVKEEALARRLYSEIKEQPASKQFSKFKELARRASIDGGSSRAGGYLGQVMEGEMVEGFEKAVFGSDPNEVTGPFKSDFGWHLSYVTTFRSKPVSEICRRSLEVSIRKAGSISAKPLSLGLQPIDRASLPDEIFPLIGDEWQGPLMDGERNLMYINRHIRSLSETIRVVTRHTEYVYGKLMATPAPMVCARSLRDSWAFDCERKLIGRADLAEFEGRAATGRKLVDIHIPLQKLQLRAIDPTKSDVQLYEYACNSGMLPIKNANPAVNTDAAR
jgi:hypothetical protein